MHPKTVVTKTSKGILEIKNKSLRLPRDLGVLFVAVDGKASIADLLQITGMPESRLLQALNRLMAYAYIRIVWNPAGATQSSLVSDDFDLDFTQPSVIAQAN